MSAAVSHWRDRITVRVRKLPGREEWRCTVTYPKHKADNYRGGRHCSAATPAEAIIGALEHLKQRLIKRVTFRPPRRPRARQADACTPVATGN